LRARRLENMAERLYDGYNYSQVSLGVLAARPPAESRPWDRRG